MTRSDASPSRPRARWRIGALVVVLIVIGVGYRWEQDHLANRREIQRLTHERDIAEGGRDSLASRLEQERRSVNHYLQQLEQFEWEKKLVGQPIAVEGFTFAGEPFDWDAYRGKIVLLDIWALPTDIRRETIYADPIHSGLKALQQLYRDLNRKGFEIVGINYDREERHSVLRSLLDQRDIPWIHLTRHKDIWPTVNGQRPDPPPLCILIDREGKVVAVFGGLTTELVARINELAAGESSP